MEFFWYLLTLIGTPELWLLVVAIPTGYLVIRNLSNEKKTFRHRQLLLFTLSMLAVLFLTVLIKAVAGMPRPCTPCPSLDDCNPYCPSGLFDQYSFPSGHTATIFAVFTALYLGSQKKRYLPLFFIPILVALSRFYLGVHTMADVLGGTVLGIGVPILVDILLMKKFS